MTPPAPCGKPQRVRDSPSRFSRIIMGNFRRPCVPGQRLGTSPKMCNPQKWRDENSACATFHSMSVVQIINELPRLTPADLLAVRRKLIEISEENEDVSVCDAAALEGARLLDRMETGDGAR